MILRWWILSLASRLCLWCCMLSLQIINPVNQMLNVIWKPWRTYFLGWSYWHCQTVRTCMSHIQLLMETKSMFWCSEAQYSTVWCTNTHPGRQKGSHRQTAGRLHLNKITVTSWSYTLLSSQITVISLTKGRPPDNNPPGHSVSIHSHSYCDTLERMYMNTKNKHIFTYLHLVDGPFCTHFHDVVWK